MYLIDAGKTSAFFAGDTALGTDTHGLVERVLWERGQELDLAMLPIGYAPWWKPGFRRGHLTHNDALELFERLRARIFIPYHWGTFRHVTATAHEDSGDQVNAKLRLSYPLESSIGLVEPASRALGAQNHQLVSLSEL